MGFIRFYWGAVVKKCKTTALENALVCSSKCIWNDAQQSSFLRSVIRMGTWFQIEVNWIENLVELTIRQLAASSHPFFLCKELKALLFLTFIGQFEIYEVVGARCKNRFSQLTLKNVRFLNLYILILKDQKCYRKQNNKDS